MAISGLLLSLFVLGHLVGNLQIFADPYFINSYAYKLHNLPYGLLWVIRFGLLAVVAVHVWTSIVLTLENRKARPQSYDKDATAEASLSSRTMRVSGIIVLLFLIFHLAHYTVKNVPGHEYGKAIQIKDVTYEAKVPLKLPESKGGAVLKTPTGEDKYGYDVHTMMIAGFSHLWITGIYLVAVFLLCNHLSHGVSSMFQSLGMRNSGSRKSLDLFARIYGIGLFLGYSSIPVAVLLGIIKVQGIPA